MAAFRLRFTIRRLLIVVLAAALLLAALVAVRDHQRRQARIQQVRSEILVNDLAEGQAGAMAEHAKRKNDPQAVREHERGRELLHEQGLRLREKLSRLQD